MTQDEIAAKVEEAQKNIGAAIEGLVKMDAPASEYSAPLQKAADLLTELQQAHVHLDGRRFEESLAALAKQVNAAGVLLESAAALHFGNVLNSRALDGGYERDGALCSFGGDSFRIDG